MSSEFALGINYFFYFFYIRTELKLNMFTLTLTLKEFSFSMNDSHNLERTWTEPKDRASSPAQGRHRRRDLIDIEAVYLIV